MVITVLMPWKKSLAWNLSLRYTGTRPVCQSWQWIRSGRNPIVGRADRQAFDIFCHNVILELLVDFGFVGTILVLGCLIVKQLNIYLRIPKNHKVLYIMFFAPCLSLMVSGSYLTSFNVGLYLGFSYLLSKLRDKRRYQKYRYI